jgi:GNAT superfamily N-acetyltransferase
VALKHAFTAPVLFSTTFDASGFDCGEISLNDWLQQRASKNQALSASRTYVCCEQGSNSIAGYYALAAGHMQRDNVSGSMGRNMPKEVPGVHLGRLAVDKHFQGTGLARLLLTDALYKSKNVARQIAARLVFVHALNESAADFYLHFGFKRLPIESLTLALDLHTFSD